ncbi:hypothetical protein UACE39S_03709 [Ureibacillus acetophenoni]
MKKIILVPALLGVMGIGGIIVVAGGSLVGSASELTVEEIKEKALAEVNGTIREVEFEKEGSKTFYEIEIATEDAEYDLKFDASTGKLIKKHKDDRDDQKQVLVNGGVNQNNDNSDDSNNKEQTVPQISSSNKETIKTEQKQTVTSPTTNQGIKQDDDYDDDDRYDDDHRYEDDDRYDDDDDNDDDDDDDDNDD